MKVGIFGRGRLGSAIAAGAAGSIAWQVGREAPPDREVDVAIDASTGPAVSGHLDWALGRGCQLVIGATGFEIPDLESRVGKRIGVVVAPNFSLTVALLARLTRVVARYAAADDRFDPYIVEHHPARKADAPSGTAKMLANVVLRACPRKESIATPDRRSIAKNELCVSAIRAGDRASSHTVGLEADDEALLLTHEARSVRAYAAGAMAACRWLGSRRGIFTMEDVARDVLDPLFREEHR
jgi:4-hydroxy-tetrahydrodipicolinate reductase